MTELYVKKIKNKCFALLKKMAVPPKECIMTFEYSDV